MKHEERSQSVVALLLGLVVVIVLIVMGMSTLDRSSQNTAFPAQSNELPTVVDETTTSLVVSSTKTESYLITQKAILISTIVSITRTPHDTPIPPPTGTFMDETVKFSAKIKGLDALNGWFGFVDGNQIVIYAGSLLDDPDQGAIAILIKLPYRNFSEKVLTTTKHGGVRVVAEQNNRLTLQAADGETFYFDVPARRFVPSLIEVVPTATLPPTYTPYAPAPDPYPMPGAPVPDFNPYPIPLTPLPFNTYSLPAEPGAEAP